MDCLFQVGFAQGYFCLRFEVACERREIIYRRSFAVGF